MSFPIPLEVFREAYRKTGLRPMVSEWVNVLWSEESGQDPVRCGCPMAVLLVDHLGWDETGDIVDEENGVITDALQRCGFTLTEEELDAFVRGVDCEVAPPSWTHEGREAYHFGRRVRREIVDPLMAKDPRND